MPSAIHLDPQRTAYFERAGWQAYYDRNWPRTFALMVRLNREMFRMSWWTAIAASLDTVRAAKVFAPVDHDLDEVLRHLTLFFQKARASLGIATDAATLAERELDYWVVHRDLAIRRKADRRDSDINDLVESLTQLHAAIFGAEVEAMRPSGFLRSMAAVAVDRITGGYSENVEADWQEAEEYLCQAYQAVNLALHGAKSN